MQNGDITKENNVNSGKPPPWLFRVILNRIDLEKQIRRVKKVVSILFFAGAGVLVTAVLTFLIIGGNVVHSEFWRFLSLLFTDSELIMSNWYNYGLALLESVPGLNVVAILFVIVLTLGLIILLLDAIEKWLSLRKKVKDLSHGRN